MATPGRLSDLLNKKKFNLEICKYITLDEADRLLDIAFEEEIRNILDHFSVNQNNNSNNFLFFLLIIKRERLFSKKKRIKNKNNKNFLF